MAFPTNDLLQEVVKLDPVKRMKASVRSSIKYGAMVGVTTVVGGILGGPVGLAMGGIVSSCLAAYTSREEFQSVPYIILYETTPEQKRILTEAIVNLLKSKHITTLSNFMLSMRNIAGLEEAIIQIVIMFLSSELKMCIKT